MITVLLLGLTSGLAQPWFVDGDLRVECLSPTLVRLELKGPKGFEDRVSFTVVNRPPTGIPYKKLSTPQAIILSTSNYLVRIPKSRKGLRGVSVEGLTGKWKYSYDGLPRPSYLPDPGAKPAPFMIADSPRLIPPKGGAIPKPLGAPLEETSGYDTGNDAPDLYVFAPQSHEELRRDILTLTGPVPMLPKYALGYYDSRWFPYTEEQALDTVDQYRKRRIPLDLLVVDTDWRIGGSKGYEPDPKYFPNMPRFLERAHAKGVKVMFNDHPEPQSPGALDPAETAYRANGLSSLLKMGLDAWWFDRNWVTSLNEPMPGIRKEVWGQSVFHDVTLATNPNLRPFMMSNVEGIDNGVLHYAPHPASHRYPIWWTGDTQTSWPALKLAIENSVNSGVSSLLPYVHEDLGGHVGQPSPELYTRYLQWGAVSPIMRVHCTAGRYREPWRFGAETEQLIGDAIRFRYRLIPTLYSATREANLTGRPIARRLDLTYPQIAAANTTSEYLLGSDLLVAPVISSFAAEAESVKALLRTLTGEPGLQAEYFAGKELAGTPLLTRTELDVNFDWNDGSPDPKVPANGFSARWTGTIGPIPETREYSFNLTSDDGARLFIDAKPVILAWKDQDTESVTGTIRLEQGKTYPIRVEYYENSGAARIRLGWRPVTDVKPTVKTNVWIPPGSWIDLWTGEAFQGPRNLTLDCPLAKLPIFLREGGIVFLGSDAQTTAEQATMTMTAHVFVPRTRSASERTVYDDDGISNDYLKGESSTRGISVERSAKNLVSIYISPSTGGYSSAHPWNLSAHLPAGMRATDIRLDGVLTPHLERSATGPARGVLDLFQPRGGGTIELDLGVLPRAASHRITFKLARAAS